MLIKLQSLSLEYQYDMTQRLVNLRTDLILTALIDTKGQFVQSPTTLKVFLLGGRKDSYTHIECHGEWLDFSGFHSYINFDLVSPDETGQMISFMTKKEQLLYVNLHFYLKRSD